MHICGLTTKIIGLVLTGSVCKWCVDKMPTGQNANLGWHFVCDFCLWLAFCPDQLFGTRLRDHILQIMDLQWKFAILQSGLTLFQFHY